MRNRLLLTGLYWMSLMSLAWAANLPGPVWVLLTLAAIPGVARRMHPSLRFTVEALLVAAQIFFVGAAWAVILQVVMAMAALSMARSPRPSADRAILGSLPIAAVAAFVHPSAGLIFVPIGLVAVLALINTGESNPAREFDRTRLALILALMAAVGATVVGLVVHLLPWQAVIAAIFAAVAYPFLALFSHVHLHYHGRNPFRRESAPGARLTNHAVTSHPPVIITVLLVLFGLAVLALLIYAAYHYWARNDRPVEDEVQESGIVREALEGQFTSLIPRSRRPLTPVRRLAYERLRQAKRRRAERAESETLREWLLRAQPGLDGSVHATYDAIRYGDEPDTMEKRRRVESQWPRSPF